MASSIACHASCNDPTHGGDEFDLAQRSHMITKQAIAFIVSGHGNILLGWMHMVGLHFN